MRKVLISIIVCLLLIGLINVMVRGVSGTNINGFLGLREENQMVDKKNQELSNVISVTYQNTESGLENSANKLTNSKAEYENQVALSNLNQSSYASQLEKYEIDFLWTKLGNYAKEENVVIKIDVTTNKTTSSLYDLNFSVTGGYVNITDFIYDIENDSRLGFKIDNFKMEMSAGVLLATFSCKEISLNVGKVEDNAIDQKSNTENTEKQEETEKTQDTTKKTNSTTNTTKQKTNSTSSNTANNTNDIDKTISNLTR